MQCEGEECGGCITELRSIEALEKADRLVVVAEVPQRAGELEGDLMLVLGVEAGRQRTAVRTDRLRFPAERVVDAAPFGLGQRILLASFAHERSHAGQHPLRVGVVEGLPERCDAGLPVSSITHPDNLTGDPALSLAHQPALHDARLMTGVVVREATRDDAAALAVLKVTWSGRPGPAAPDELHSFSSDLSSWMGAQGDSLIARVAEHAGALVGMAWLVVFDRVPDIDDRSRRTGDIQSVFVLPDHRRRGVGSALIASLLREADERRIPRVTVSANTAAAQLYEKAGFRAPQLLLERRLERPDAP